MPEFSSPAVEKPLQRIASIDILRALTMVLMVFINDIVTLNNIPLWLDHVERGVDGIGLADVVYPAFLFIVGLSLYFAISQRTVRGDTDWQMVKHVLIRSAALLIMGALLINPFTVHAQLADTMDFLWNPLCVLGFILIFNTYPKTSGKQLSTVLKVAGIGLLIALFLAYGLRYSSSKESEGISRFAPQHWGILGGIGWTYLISSLVLIFSRNKFWPILLAWVFFCLVSMASKEHLIPRDGVFRYIAGSITGGTLIALTLGGVLISYLFQYFRDRKDNIRLTLIFLVISALLIFLSVYTRQFWGLAKLGATPAWLFLCSAFTILAFTAVYWIADIKGKATWFDVIKPAGTDTILTYLIPYILYTLIKLLDISVPEVLLTGWIGLLKSLLFAFLCVWITKSLNKLGIRLKL